MSITDLKVLKENGIDFEKEVEHAEHMKGSIDLMVEVVNEYRKTLPDVLTNVGCLVAMTREEHDEFETVVSNFMERSESVLATVEAPYDKNDKVACVLRNICIEGTVAILDEWFVKANDFVGKINDRIDSGEMLRYDFAEVIATVWSKYDESVANFHYSNLEDVVVDKNPFWVIEESNGVHIIATFGSKCEAQIYAMSHGVPRNIICRY